MPAMRFFAVCRLVTPILLFLFAAAPFPAVADDSRPVEKPDVSVSPKQHLDDLFASLKRQRDPDQAAAIANQIKLEWAKSGSATVDLLMQWADQAVADKRNPAAFDFLDQIIALKPDYAEAWNRRATLNYALGDYRKSMADIEQVLRLEPRHFGALAGMAAILSENGKDQQTLEVWQRFLAIYPASRPAQQQMDALTEKMAGSRT
jgi:tetratricopeptide (TPR) repeat protein